MELSTAIREENLIAELSKPVQRISELNDDVDTSAAERERKEKTRTKSARNSRNHNVDKLRQVIGSRDGAAGATGHVNFFAEQESKFRADSQQRIRDEAKKAEEERLLKRMIPSMFFGQMALDAAG